MFVYEFNATDPNGDYLTYSILYGPDANAFDLNGSNVRQVLYPHGM